MKTTIRVLKMMSRWSALFVVLGAAAFLMSGCAGLINQMQIDAGTSYNASTGYNESDVTYLSGYGDWVSVPPYGQVWQPWVAPGWAPFSYGHWAWSDPDWAWVSYEPYGWLVYHYGEWGYRNRIGWFWVPGDTWSPARVQWDTWGDYCGWAPIPANGIAWGDPWNAHYEHAWTVVRMRDFDRENIGRYRVGSLPHGVEMRRYHVHNQQPAIAAVRSNNRRQVVVVKSETKAVRMGQKEYKRMNLHAEQQKVVATQEKTVRKRVLVTKEQYHKRIDRERAKGNDAGNAKKSRGNEGSKNKNKNKGSAEQGGRQHRR